MRNYTTFFLIVTLQTFASGGRRKVTRVNTPAKVFVPCEKCYERDRLRVDDGLDFIVHHEHQRTTDTTKDVGEGTLEEGTDAFLGVDLHERISSAVVQLLARARVHHQTTTNSVEGVGKNTGGVRRDLRDDELEDERRILGEERTLTGVIETEVGATVDDDTLHGDAETLVERHRTGAAGNLGEAVNQTGEFTRLVATDIGGETGTREIKRIDNQQRTGTGQTTGRHVDGEERPESILRVVGREHALDGILERKVEGLRREITNDVRRVTSPEGADALLGAHTREAVDDTRVSRNFARHDSRVRILRLNQELDTLDRRGGRLRDGAGHTTLRVRAHEIENALVSHIVRRRADHPSRAAPASPFTISSIAIIGYINSIHRTQNTPEHEPHVRTQYPHVRTRSS